MKRRHGFTLFEMLIVVTVFSLVAAILMPNLIASLKGGKESAAINALRTLSTVNQQYYSRHGRYAVDLDDLETDGYIDTVLGTGTRQGYVYGYTGGIEDWSCTATPEEPGVTGDRFFFVDDSGVIRYHHTSIANSTDPPVD